MAIARIAQPSIYQEHGSNSPAAQKDPITEAASQSFTDGHLLYTSGTGASTVIQKCASDAVLCYGMAARDAYTATTGSVVQPPNSIHGAKHYPFDVRDRIIEINISNSSASGAQTGTTSGVTWAGGGTGGVALAPGQQYGLITHTSGTYSGQQFLDVSDTTNLLFEIVGLSPNQETTDNNPRVLVKIIPTKIQG